MKEESLGQRTKRLIKDADLSPRILSAVTKVHYTTIYSIMRSTKADGDSYPSIVHSITKALDGVERLLETHVLPFGPETSHELRAELLQKLLDDAT